jgi:hypothetical protein
VCKTAWPEKKSQGSMALATVTLRKTWNIVSENPLSEALELICFLSQSEPITEVFQTRDVPSSLTEILTAKFLTIYNFRELAFSKLCPSSNEHNQVSKLSLFNLDTRITILQRKQRPSHWADRWRTPISVLSNSTRYMIIYSFSVFRVSL